MGESDSRLHTRPSLLLRLRDPKDGEAWRTFEAVYRPLVVGYCRKRGLQPADAEDVFQEVLAQVDRSIKSFDYDPERGRFRDWLGRVTRNKMARLMKKADTPGRGTGGEAESSELEAIEARSEDTAWTEEFNGHIYQTAKERIRPEFEADTWGAFQLVVEQDRPAKDVARELGKPIARVHEAKYRVTKRLRQEIEELAEDVAWLFR